MFPPASPSQDIISIEHPSHAGKTLPVVRLWQPDESQSPTMALCQVERDLCPHISNTSMRRLFAAVDKRQAHERWATEAETSFLKEARNLVFLLILL